VTKAPQRHLVGASGFKKITTQSLPKSNAELQLGVGGQLLLIQKIVGIGIQQAVTQDRGSQLALFAEHGLQSAGGPCVPAGLHNIGHAERRVKLPGPGCQLLSCR
jgi:hypothetical protein